jgi:hemoglobin-like flavoprotein
MSRESQLIRASFSLIADMPEAVVMLFYGRLFELDPSLRNLFKIDMRAQSKKLAETLLTIAQSADDLARLSPMLRSLGRSHVVYGVQPEHYETLRLALLWALGQALQEDFDPETRAAWNSLLQMVSKEMLAGAGDGVTPS